MSVVPFVIKHLVNRKFNVASFIDESSFASLSFDVNRKSINDVSLILFLRS